MTDFTEVFVNAWELRCIFNHSRIAQRLAIGEFTQETGKKANLSKQPNHPQGTRSQMVYIFDATGDELVTAHHYVCRSGPVTPLDPKAIKIGKIRYIIHSDRVMANPEHRLPCVWMRKIYGWIQRKIICPIFGPIDLLP